MIHRTYSAPTIHHGTVVLKRVRGILLPCLLLFALVKGWPAFPQGVEPQKKLLPDSSFWKSTESKFLFVRKEYVKENETTYLPFHSIWVTNQEGLDQRFIAYCQTGFALFPVLRPTLSPDKKKIVFIGLEENTTRKLGIPPENGLWLFDLENNRKQRLMSERISHALWTADNKWLYFEKGIQGLFKLNIDTGEVIKVRSFGQMEEYKDTRGETFWGGTNITLHDILEGKLLYTRLSYRKDTTSIETKGKEKITKVTFTPHRKHIWILAPPHTNPVWLTEGDAPRFSPDGKYILFFRGNEIWYINSGGGAERKIGIGNYPAFSPDNQRVAFVDAGVYKNPNGWIQLYVADLYSGAVTHIPMIPTWKEILSQSIHNFERSFATIGYFNEKPQLFWLSDDKILYTIGYSTFFLADLKTKTTEPLFTWFQNSPSVAYIDPTDGDLILTSPMIHTSRREKHPLFRSGELEEEDIWKVSLDGKNRRMIVENGAFLGWIGRP
jgi:Tol biopolymer transport system component